MKFEYVVHMISGYQPIGQLKPEKEVRFVIEANNRVTADRMIRMMLKGATNVKDCNGTCID